MNSKLLAGQLGARMRHRVSAISGLMMLVLLAGASCARTDPARHWSLDEIRSEFSNVKTPGSARPTEEVRVVKKYGATSVSGRYAANGPDEEILSHYRTALQSDGWQFVSTVRTVNGVGHFGESYCKNKLLATVELLNAGPATARGYAFSISWGEISEKKCP
jgi:hypothetical protein